MEIRGNREFDHLILKYNNELKIYEDITRKVIYIKKNQNSWFAVSENRETYNFELNDIVVGCNSTEVDLRNKKVLIDNKETKVFKILKFDNLGYKIFLHGQSKHFFNALFTENTIEFNFIDINTETTDNQVFDYYKALSKYASELSNDEKSIDSLMFKLYDNITKVNPISVLNSYTNQKILSRKFDKTKMIYPFNTNLSQNQAIHNAFSENLSIISGPPGTGKTQVILNIIANCIYQNKKVAVISNNNTAIENVYIKMKEYGFDFLIAYLGNRDNVDKFFEHNDDIKENIKKLQHYKKQDNNIYHYQQTIEKFDKTKIRIQEIKQEIIKFDQEKKHFQSKYTSVSNLNLEDLNYSKLLKLQKFIFKVNKLNFLNRIILKIKYKISIKSQVKLELLQDYLNLAYYDFKIEQLVNEKKELENFINNNNYDDIVKMLKKDSFDSLCNSIFKKYESKQFVTFNASNYRMFFNDFIDRYPVTLSTTHSLLRNCKNNFLYDLVIIDEASQSDILTSLLTMNVAKNMVIIGDSKQLSQIDNKEIYGASEELAKHYKIKKCYQYKDNSILESVIKLPVKVKNTILKEHYRCESRIIDFCNKKFYDSNLIICTNKSNEDSLIIVHTVEGNHARRNPHGTGQYNDREAQEILEILSTLDEKDVGIITPFRAQADYILKLIRDRYPNVEVDTIHKYQGRQKKVIILSTVVNDLKEVEEDFISNFVTNDRLLNVAISRAIDKIYLVVSDKVYNSKNNNISEFIDYIKYYSNNYKKGVVVSIFDELYKMKYEVIKKTPLYKKVDSYAEELVLSLIKDILKDFNELDVSLHVKLSDLITDFTGFSVEELKYINHKWTHVDFVIFNKITHRPVLCIEVDGTKYHDYNYVQKEHDLIKNEVLRLNNLKLLRIRTNESNEKEKIISNLNNTNS